MANWGRKPIRSPMALRCSGVGGSPQKTAQRKRRGSLTNPRRPPLLHLPLFVWAERCLISALKDVVDGKGTSRPLAAFCSASISRRYGSAIGYTGAISVHRSPHGTMRSISARNFFHGWFCCTSRTPCPASSACSLSSTPVFGQPTDLIVDSCRGSSDPIVIATILAHLGLPIRAPPQDQRGRLCREGHRLTPGE